ncbi:hypothetical protein AB1Y20_018557 [Prymnesium parvum]|uniref:Solute carrier family 40 protein n=1 Tax=Prymnesium parvum TaxID=97485 RepID=A0AB34JSC7_PRYPA
MENLNALLFAAVQPQKQENKRKVKRLTGCTIFSFGIWRTACLYSSGTLNSLYLLYTEGMGMTIGTLAVLRALGKCVDFVTGFAVGYYSDNLKSRFGRRRPFIFVGAWIAAFATYFLGRPPQQFATYKKVGSHADALICAAERAALNCSAVRECVDRLIGEGALSAWNAVEDDRLAASAAETPHASPLLSVWFFVWFGVRVTMAFTVAEIPHEALSQELSDDPQEKTRIFFVKALYGAVGIYALMAVSIPLSLFMGSDLQGQISILFTSAAILFGLTATILCINVKEKPTGSHSLEKEATPPFVPTLLDILWRNKPFQKYIMLKICMAFTGYLPFHSFMYFLKFVAKMENTVFFLNAFFALQMMLTPFMLRIMNVIISHLGVTRTLVVMSYIHSAYFLAFGLNPSSVPLVAVYPVVLCAVGTIEQIIPDALLSDLLDYDELRSGLRREGAYVVMNMCVLQLSEIVAGVLPGIIFSAVGYLNNGGCSCGCGIDCPLPVMRWSCPGDIGYACSTKLGPLNPPFYGDPSRKPPCTFQNDTVIMFSTIFVAFGPSLFAFICGILALSPPLHHDAFLVLKQQLRRRKKGLDVYDPVTREPIEYKEGEALAASHAVGHYTGEEINQLIKSKGNAVKLMRSRIICQNSAVAVVAGISLLIILACVGSPAIFMSVTFFGMLATFMSVLLAMNTLRLTNLTSAGHYVRYFVNLARYEKVFPKAAFKNEHGKKSRAAANSTAATSKLAANRWSSLLI